jgi:hypothetical protein
LQLVTYAPIGDVGKLRSSCLAAKIDPSVCVFDDGMMTPVQPQDKEILPTLPDDPCDEENNKTSIEEHNDHTQQECPVAVSRPHEQSKIYHVSSWRPHDLFTKYIESLYHKLSQYSYFHHVTNFVAHAEALSKSVALSIS